MLIGSQFEYIAVMHLESETFYHIPSAIIVLRSFDTKYILYKVDSPKHFSSAISVAATHNTCFVSKQEVPSDHGRKPDSAPLRILMYLCNLSHVTGLT